MSRSPAAAAVKMIPGNSNHAYTTEDRKHTGDEPEQDRRDDRADAVCFDRERLAAMRVRCKCCPVDAERDAGERLLSVVRPCSAMEKLMQDDANGEDQDECDRLTEDGGGGMEPAPALHGSVQENEDQRGNRGQRRSPSDSPVSSTGKDRARRAGWSMNRWALWALVQSRGGLKTPLQMKNNPAEAGSGQKSLVCEWQRRSPAALAAYQTSIAVAFRPPLRTPCDASP